jgi:hypothetical protein
VERAFGDVVVGSAKTAGVYRLETETGDADVASLAGRVLSATDLAAAIQAAGSCPSAPTVALLPERPGSGSASSRSRSHACGSGRAREVSSRGGYFVTPRPWVIGSDIDLELPIGDARLLASRRIVYTNPGDDADRKGLPRGMSVAFRPLPQPVRQMIREDVLATHAGLAV